MLTTDSIKTINSGAIIIGAGPAGAGASIYLTKAGINHVIIEKEIFPRDKVCGDACSRRTTAVLRKANPEWLTEIFQSANSFAPVKGALFLAPNGKSLTIPFSRNNIPPGQTAGFTGKRILFDHFLFEKLPSAYAAIYQEAKEIRIERQLTGGISVSFLHQGESIRVNAPCIIGADGDKSQVRKIFLPGIASSRSYCVALRAYYEGVKDMQDNMLEVHYLPEVLPGYFWIFPLSNGMVNVGLGIVSKYIRKKRINLREIMTAAISNNPMLRERFKDASLVGKIQGWGIPMGVKRQAVSGDHFMLTGDAAGLVDPFTGEGIGNALYSGMLAAQAIEAGLENENFSAAFLKKNYDDILYADLGDELKTSARLQRLCHYPWFFRFVVNKAHRSPTLNKAISQMFTGVNLRKELASPSFYAKVLLNK